MSVPDNPIIYHITHIDNLPKILQCKELRSDRKMLEQESNYRCIGMTDIKRRRLEERPVSCHEHLMVGECVPFYFCPRSIMLYIIHRGNNPNIHETNQADILHLEADMKQSIDWAERKGLRWSFSDRNAALETAVFFRSLESLHELDWAAIQGTNFSRVSGLMEAKQAEFLVETCFSWDLMTRIGVMNQETESKVQKILQECGLVTPISVLPNWYF